MSKQPSLFNFMSRSENEINKKAIGGDDAAQEKSGKFKFNVKSSKPTPKPETNGNRSINIIKSVEKRTVNLSTASNTSDCVIIDDDDHGFSSAKSILAKSDKDDCILTEFETPEITFFKPSKTTTEATCMEDLYTKYGTPNKNGKSSIETFDIDKELNSNASYVNAMKKLDENMQQLKASPKKTSIGKFKFNTRSKPATITSESNISHTSNSTSKTFNISHLSTSASVKNGTESTASVVKPSTIVSGTMTVNKITNSNSKTNSTSLDVTLSGNSLTKTATDVLKNSITPNPYKPIPTTNKTSNKNNDDSS